MTQQFPTPKRRWTFIGKLGDRRVVIARSEGEARHLAMEERWGPMERQPKWIQDNADPAGRYQGAGLILALE